MATASNGSILTVGHSNIPFEAFVGNLRRNGVRLVIDVRSHPWSRYAVQFNRPEIERPLRDSGVRYVYLGRYLGGRSDEFLDAATGRVRYDKMADSPLFKEGIDMLMSAAAHHPRVAVMCSEEDPAGCHRYRLIGRVLTDHGYEVGHIRSDGRIESQDEVDQRDKGAQPSLFPDQEKQWQSVRPIRSGSRSTQPRSSSRR